ncbi:sulfide dehydrogenase [flavocytochrome c] flavoprotein chain precursor [mine drainage metagenome]|uniref:Sulfide dehydrogenase [flavocytochrome c] flavoprotein chain n=1 Tax=mine drainage metagenome TaxID=410659 RepID=A0A1J5PD20_9ZZZZ
MIERVSLSQGGRVVSVEPATNTLVTDFGDYDAQVANVIPPQKAGRIAALAGAVDNTGWCPIDPLTFASKLVPNIHVIGDACIGGGIPKSASAANAEAKACAAKGGKIQPVCMRGLPACVIPYRDAGKTCRDKADCQGRCLYQGERPADPETPVTGQCQATSNPCGCFAEVEHGHYLRGLCVD